MKHVSILFPKAGGTIAPEIYGHFSEHIGGVFYDGLWVGKDSDIPNINGFRRDLVEKLRAIHPPVLRWPGGCFAETYSWRDGIGKNRPIRLNWWTRHDGRYESNAVGTHEFVELCELIGAKPYFAVNVTSCTPLDALEWMDYCLSPRGSTTLAMEREANGHPEPFDIPFWGIGNENWGGGGNMDPDYYALQYRKYATILRNTGYPVELFVGGANAADYNWTRHLCGTLERYKRLCDGMSFHYYTSQKSRGVTAEEVTNCAVDGWNAIMERAARMEELIVRHHGITVGYGMEERTKLVIDEWGCWHPDGSGPSHGYNLFEQQSTMRDAVVSALTLNIFNKHCDKIRMANVAQLCNNLHCLFLAGGEHCITTPTYHVFDMYQEHQGAALVDTAVSDNADLTSSVSASASIKNGKLLITLANLSYDTATDISLDFLGRRVTGDATVRLLAGENANSHNTFENPDAVTPTTFVVDPAQTITLPAAAVMAISVAVE